MSADSSEARIVMTPSPVTQVAAKCRSMAIARRHGCAQAEPKRHLGGAGIDNTAKSK
jgi:hypothetical protein